MDAFHTLLKKPDVTKADLRASYGHVLKQTVLDLQKSPSGRHLANLGVWPEVRDLYEKLSSLLNEHLLRTSQNEWQTFSEQDLYSNDGLLLGKLDAYFLNQADAEAEVVDYKSGIVHEGEIPKEDYVNQLYFYAYLIQEKHLVYPGKLSLIDKNLETTEIKGSPEKSQRLASDMRFELEKYNQQVEKSAGTVQTTPSPEACTYCDFRLICQDYWDNSAAFELPLWSQTAQGMQLGAFSRSKQGAVSIDLMVNKGSLAGQQIKIGGIFDGRFPSLKDKPGQLLSFVDLKIKANVTGYADVSDRTVITVLDNRETE
jgi:CRISPR/Cas system-associated exonuclease Cas4 (RecB family)